MFLARSLANTASKSILNKPSFWQAGIKYNFSDFKGNKHNERISQLNKQQLHLKTKSQQNSQQPVLTQQERMKMQEEKQSNTNRQVIKRELKNDCIQLPVKAIAYFMAPINLQPTFYAELIRSCIDSLNHVVLYGMNYVKMGPNEKYPYGIEKLKNFVVLIPSFLFVYLGSEILVESATSLIDSHEEVTSSFSLISTSLYLVSIGVEMNVIYSNIKDALKLDGDYDAQQKQSVTEIFKKLINKKDPLLQAILYENAITFLSTSIPMLCSIFTYLYPTKVIEVLGSTIISSISIYLGIHLFKTNVKQLIGEEQIDKEDLNRIIHIAKANSLLKDISELRAVKHSSEKFRLSAKIEFDMKKLTFKVISKSEQNLQKIIKENSNIYSQEKRQETFTKSAANLVLSELMKEIQNQINIIQDSIREEFPNCEHIDLEITHQENAEQDYITTALEDMSSQYNIVQNGDTNDEITQDFGEFVLQSADRILKTYARRNKRVSSKTTQQDYMISQEYLNNKFEDDLIEEYYLIYDQQRKEAYPDFIKNKQFTSRQN